jgi:hypothetical protein
MAVKLVPDIPRSANYMVGGMNFLQLVQRLRQEVGAGGTGPANVENQIGESARLVSWIRQAWIDIQSLHKNWRFMHQPVRFTTVAGKQSYNNFEMKLASNANLRLDAFRWYPASDADDRSGEMFLPYMTYEDFYDMYLFGPMVAQQRQPDVFTVTPTKDLMLGPTPDAVYTIRGEAFAMPSEMTANEDRPNLPSEFHMAIVYRAMMFYGSYEAAPEIYSAGALEFNRMLNRMMADQLPPIGFGPPLA